MIHERRQQAGAAEPMPHPAGDEPATAAPMGDGWGNAACDGCDDYGCGDDWFGNGRRGAGRWLAGVEFLFACPHFSESTAYILAVRPGTGAGNLPQLISSDTFVQHRFDYEPSARGYIAYRLDECCAELRATYTRLDSDTSLTALATIDANSAVTPTYFEIQPVPGNTLTSSVDVAGDVFDVDLSRCIRAGGECIPCDCRTCPDWDLSWSAGARIARWDLNQQVFTNQAATGRLDMDQEFIGGGPKIGLEGNRYFGRCQQFSIYSSFDAALILGWYEYDMARTVPNAGVAPGTVESFHSRVTRTVPVTEIELGVRWQPYERLNLSAGWFFQAWWDLGNSTQQTSNLLGGLGPQFLLDDSNIMSWDGLTVRAELSF
jgi:hypothetical protein